jgi:hypothetical protein
MSLQDVLTAPLFKRDQENRLVMFPNGALGGGYFVPDADTEKRLRKTLMWVIISAGAFGGFGSQIMMLAFGQPAEWTLGTWAVAVGALAVLAFGYRLVASRLSQGLAPSQMRLGLGEALMRQADAMPRWYLWTIAIGGGLMAAGSLYGLLAADALTERALAVVGLALFGTIVLQGVHGLRRARA